MLIVIALLLQPDAFKDLDVLIAEQTGEPLESVRKRLGVPERLSEDQMLMVLMAPAEHTRDAA